MTTETINKQLVFTAILFIVTVLIFELTKLDIYIFKAIFIILKINIG